MAAKSRSPVKRDSFSDLTVMMKAKKPYTPIRLPTPKAPLSIATNGEQRWMSMGSCTDYFQACSLLAVLAAAAFTRLWLADIMPMVPLQLTCRIRLDHLLR